MLSRYTGARYRAGADPDLVAYVESDELHALDFEEACDFYAAVAGSLTDADIAYLGCVDRFFLFTAILGRTDGFHPWLYDRCREVELEPDGFLDLWSREHYKSSLITYTGTIQEIINNPEITIGVFSHTKGIAEKFVAQVKREFEANSALRRLYADVCWLKPTSEAPKWSDKEFTIRRTSNPKECTMESHGLVDGQPTSKHFALLVYDDVVTRESVTNPDQIKKTTEAWELSDNLGAGDRRKWMIGTRYHFGDTYGDLLQRGVVIPRIYPATEDGTVNGKPVLLSQSEWDKKKKTQLSTLAAQMLQNPLSGKERTFEPEWLQGWEIRPALVNVYIMVDPSRGARATSDRTAMVVIAIDGRGTKFLVDGYCHRMNLNAKWAALKNLHRKWTDMPGVQMVKVGYERFGQQADDQYFAERMLIEDYHFTLEELAWPREGGNSKQHRVERLQPDIQYGRLRLPALVSSGGKVCKWTVDGDGQTMLYSPMQGDPDAVRRVKLAGQEYLAAKPITRRNEQNEAYDLTIELMTEMIHFPFATHDDLIDALSRIYDLDPVPAAAIEDLNDDEPIPEDV